jgi:hypothetical protein
MLRLRGQANTQIIPCMHHPRNAERTHPLHRMGKELPVQVSLHGLWLYLHSGSSDRAI